MTPFRVGMISPPSWFNYCAAELESIRPDAVRVMNTQLRLSSAFKYDLDDIRAAAGEVRDAARALARTDVDMVAQIGTPFSTVHGWREACGLERSIEREIGIPFEMMGLSPVRVCRDLGIETVTVCTVYYTRDWTESYRRFLAQAGIHAAYAGSFSDLGVLEQITMLESCRGHELCSIATMTESVSRCCEAAPDAQAVLLSGIPCPQLHMIAELEVVAGRPVVSFPAVYVRVLNRLGLTGDPALGRMFALGA